MELRSCLTYAAEIGIRQAAKYNGDQELLKKKKKKRKLRLWGWPRFHGNGSSRKVSQTISTDKQARKIAKKKIIDRLNHLIYRLQNL